MNRIESEITLSPISYLRDVDNAHNTEANAFEAGKRAQLEHNQYELSQPFPQSLLDKKLRKKLEDILLPKLRANYTKPKLQVDGATTFYDVSVISQVLVLLQQREQAELVGRFIELGWTPPEELKLKIEEAEKRGADSGVKAYESTCESLILEERERKLDEILPDAGLLTLAICYEMGLAQGDKTLYEDYPAHYNEVMSKVGKAIRNWLVNPPNGKYSWKP